MKTATALKPRGETPLIRSIQKAVGDLKTAGGGSVILITDGEEAGLMGAAGLVTDQEVMNRLRAYINLESIGSAGTSVLFETGPGNGWLVAPWARRAPHPRGGSYAVEREPGVSDVLTLSDWRVLLGVERRVTAGINSRVEIGYVFNRKLEYESSPLIFEPDSTFLVRGGLTY